MVDQYENAAPEEAAALEAMAMDAPLAHVNALGIGSTSKVAQAVVLAIHVHHPDYGVLRAVLVLDPDDLAAIIRARKTLLS